MRRLWVATPLVAALVLSACGADDVRSGDGSTTTSTSSTVVPAVGVRASDGTVEVELAVGEEAPAGERLWAELTIRNVGDHTVYWQAGGASPPGSIELVDPAAPDHAAPVPPTWSGDPEELHRSLVPSGDVPFREEGTIGLPSVARTSDSRMQPLAPGDEHVLTMAADVRLSPGASTELVARGTFLGYDEAEHYGGEDAVGPRQAVVAEAPVRVPGQPEGGDDEAIDAFAADPRLADFVEATDVAGVEQRWHVELVWWRDAWELVADPYFGDEPRGQSRYRLRFDPETGRVVDARRIWWDQAPADDPDGTRFPDAPPDDVDDTGDGEA